MTPPDDAPPLQVHRTPADSGLLVERTDAVHGRRQVHVIGALALWDEPTMTAALDVLLHAADEWSTVPGHGTVLLDLTDLTDLAVTSCAGQRGPIHVPAPLLARGWRDGPDGDMSEETWLLGFAESDGWLPSALLCEETAIQWDVDLPDAASVVAGTAA